ncbi:MAG: HD domain-containing protein [Candidatus Rickettsia vulgarisii]
MEKEQQKLDILNTEFNANDQYSKRLLDKIKQLNSATTDNKADLDIVKKAIYYAKKYHGSQMRKSDEPFYSHPLEVAYLVSDYFFRTDIIVTAILHDTIEDTELTKEMIEQEFGNIIACQVEDLTRIKGDTKISSAKIMDLLFEQGKYDVLMIKIFDRLHNVCTLEHKSQEKIDKTIEETIKYFIGILIKTDNFAIEQKFYNTLIHLLIDKPK